MKLCKTCGVEHEKYFIIPAHIMEKLELNKEYTVAGVWSGHKFVYKITPIESKPLEDNQK